jgi:hypothetical protein
MTANPHIDLVAIRNEAKNYSYAAEGRINSLCNEIESGRHVYYHEVEYVRGLEKLASAVLLFHRGGEWTYQDGLAWQVLTGSEDATTKTLCDFARKVQAK